MIKEINFEELCGLIKGDYEGFPKAVEILKSYKTKKRIETLMDILESYLGTPNIAKLYLKENFEKELKAIQEANISPSTRWSELPINSKLDLKLFITKRAVDVYNGKTIITYQLTESEKNAHIVKHMGKRECREMCDVITKALPNMNHEQLSIIIQYLPKP
jgi:hypothetical protein